MSAAKSRHVSPIVLPFALLLAGTYVFHGLNWTLAPHDEAVLVRGAERVLSGGVRHRDFAAVCIGGLDCVCALSVRLLGMRLMSLRYWVLVAVLAWMPAVYHSATGVVARPGREAFGLAVLETVGAGLAYAFPSSYVPDHGPVKRVIVFPFGRALALVSVLGHRLRTVVLEAPELLVAAGEGRA